MLDEIAEGYVRLVLGVGQHDPDYVDAYYGNPEWRPNSAAPIDRLHHDARALRQRLGAAGAPDTTDEIVRLRYAYLDRQLAAAESRIEMLAGRRFTFDEECERLYDLQPPRVSEEEFEQVLAEIDRSLPGSGPLIDRYSAFRARFVVAPDRLERVFRTAIDACRARTLAHLSLPAEETFTLEYVSGKSWSAYNWYRGKFASLIQVNTDLPITIDRTIDLASHEGYPGHHAYQTLLEKSLVRDRGWQEFTVYPLFSPQSLISEGAANFGIEVAFPGEARLAFERETLYPLADLDPSLAETFTSVQRQIDRLSHAGNEVARRYLDGEIDRGEAVDYLVSRTLTPRDRALQRMTFIEQYRSYVINYNLGQDLVRAYVEGRGGTADHPETRWREFAALLSSPRVPSGLQP